MVKNFSFKAIPSGDYESFCFDVSRDVFKEITGHEPDEEFDRSYFNEGMFRIYPEQIFQLNVKNSNKELCIEINIEDDI